MSDLLKHILVGDLIGCLVEKSKNRGVNNIATAFTLGVISHAIMDISEPDYTVNWFNSTELKNSAPFLGMQTAGIAFVLNMFIKNTKINPRAFILRIAAIIGAVIPDVIDGVYSILNPNAWYSGQLLLPWHVRTWQVNLMSMWSTTFLSFILVGFRYLTMPIYRLLKVKQAV